MSEPFPDPNRRRPISITGSKAGEPFNMAPIANVDDPNTQRNENKKTPTANINKQVSWYSKETGKLEQQRSDELVQLRNR